MCDVVCGYDVYDFSYLISYLLFTVDSVDKESKALPSKDFSVYKYVYSAENDCRRRSRTVPAFPQSIKRSPVVQSRHPHNASAIMPSVQIKTNAFEVSRWLNQKAAKQLKFAQVVALNRTAQLVKKGEVTLMKSRFDRPTPYTINSLRTEAAKKTQAVPQARVFFKDDTFKGTPATKYLPPNVYAGKRNHKRFEMALIRKGIMKSSEYAVPAQGARLDSYGNMSRGQIVQILSALGAHGEQGYTANRTSSKRSQRNGAKSRYFVMRGHGQGEGVWQRVGKRIAPVLTFAPASPRYRTRFPFFQVANNIFTARLGGEFRKAFDEAMKTAR